MSGRHFLQIPGPTNVPERVLRAMDRPVPDHRGKDLPPLVAEIVGNLKQVFNTRDGEIVIYPSSGTGGWEASIVNTIEPGDRVLAFGIGQFSHLYAEVARAHGALVDELELDWTAGVPAQAAENALAQDRDHSYRAILVVHNETSTGARTDVGAIRAALDRTRHPALLLVDSVSGLGSMDFRFDEWGVDVAVTGSQKGLMLPPGLAILCVGPRALARSRESQGHRYFFNWLPVIQEMARGYFPYTPATLMLYGLREALRMLTEEGMVNVLARHQRLAEGVRRAVAEWDLSTQCSNPADYSNSLTGVVTPPDTDANRVLRLAADKYDLSLGTGLGRLKGRMFRIGHLGALNELEVLATLAGTEMALADVGLPVRPGSAVAAAQEWFRQRPSPQ